MDTDVGHIVANQIARRAIDQFRKAGDIFAPNPSHELRQALGSVLHLASRHERLQPDTRPTHDLLAAVYEGLGGAISVMGTEISISDLEVGMLAAARLVADIDAGTLEGNRHSDDVAKTRILINKLRITEYEKEIDRRRHDRRRKAIETMRPAAKQAAFFG